MQLILLFLICTTCYASEKSSTKRSYAFYYPLSMGSKESAQVCLELDKYLLPATAKIAFTNKTCQETLCKPRTITTEYSCWKIKAPFHAQTDYQPSQIELEIASRNKGFKIRGKGKVQIHPRRETIFIETDRRFYKMGAIVKIRCLVLDFELKPAKNYKIPSIVIRSPYPSSAIVKEWKNMTVNTGLIQFEFQLAYDAPEGWWSINGQGVYGSFEVKKYVLPRFQVSITGPASIYNGSKSTSFSVCATYSYGRKVKGVALLTAKTNARYLQQPLTHSEIKKLETGCAIFEIHSDDLHLHNTTVWSLYLTAAVTEHGTNQTESTNKYVYIDRSPYSYNWDYSDQYIKPALPYKSRFWLTNVHVTFKTRRIQLCYKYDRGNNSNIACGNFTMDSNNSTEFTIPPLRNITEPQNIIIEANVLDYPLQYPATKYLTLWVSASKNAIKIVRTNQDATECGATLIFTVLYTSRELKKGKDITFKYILSSRGELISTGTVVDKPKKKILNLREYPNVIGLKDYESEECEDLVDNFKLKITLNKKIYTNAKLLVYYDLNNEVIADIVDIYVNSCSPIKVDAKWQQSPLYPGEIGKLDIKSEPESLCSVASIDKASTFLGSSQEINVNSIVNRIYRYPYFYEENCIKVNDTNANDTNAKNTKIIWPWYRPFFDSMQAFTDSSVGVISNKKLINRPCVRGPWLYEKAINGVVSSPVPIDSASRTDNRGSAVRFFFPETWLWDLVLLRKDGNITLRRKLPDSITDWVGNVICVSSKKGFGISKDIEIRAFKPFFVDLLLPYSIKRNKEILHLPVPIFNYLNHSLPIRIELTLSNDLVLIGGQAKKIFSICLGPGDSYTHTYRIKATKLGFRNITVVANADPTNVKNCASQSIIRRNDVVRKLILVEPEGYPSGMLKSALLCANDSSGANNINWKINLPKNVVPDTVDGRVIINSDILGPVFQNLENILVVPTGCGEQTMATLTPNLYVLKYLKANNALTENIEEKILKHLQVGYQRMLNYVHEDGSFSAFGRSDINGSMFLTAFVVRTFKQMAEYTFIDDDVVNKAIRWITSHQLENGCFDPVQHVFHQMGPSSSKNQTTALTSYILISFLETNTKINASVLSLAKKCILNDKTTDKYTMGISFYALVLMNSTKDVKDKWDKLLKVADHNDGMIWWSQSKTSLSTNVEITSYILLALLVQNPVKNLGIASSIVRWLQTNRNPSGSFYSTQDTVVGLDALSSYASIISKKEPNVKVFVSTKTENRTFEITKRDHSSPKIIPLTLYPNEVKANIKGDGCVSIQVSITYYLDSPVTSKDLQLTISLKPVNQQSKCSFVELKPCVSYTAPGKINMAVVEASLPSGFAADQTSLYELTSNSSSGVKKFELVRNQVIFYIIQLGADPVCLPFKIEENLIVENVANATVKFYDYYKPDVYIYKSFKVEDCNKNPKL